MKLPLSSKDIYSEQNKSIRLYEIKKILEQEAAAISLLANNVPQELDLILSKITQSSNHIFLSGIGKSGIICKKLAATFSSLGIPAMFIHPIEALHGDLGMIKPKSIIIILSKSGSGSEIAAFMQALKSNDVFVALICCNSGNLASAADLTVKIPFTSEAGELGLAPTNSSSVMLALGDALALVASRERGFSKSDFAKFHPYGALGKNLLLKVSSIMYKYDSLPIINLEATFQEIILTITAKKLGVGIVVDESENMLGIITDGDLRRACKDGSAVFDKQAADIMTKNPKVISSDLGAQKALEIMESFNITSLVVVDNDKVVGLVHIHDLIKNGIIREKS